MTYSNLPDDDQPIDPSSIQSAEDDGRNREWQDRARVNIEKPSNEQTNIERDFEPEKGEEKKKDESPAY
ncbi:MAG: hypothetical protein ABI151_12715 [Chitinophagaceae bacterium]